MEQMKNISTIASSGPLTWFRPPLLNGGLDQASTEYGVASLLALLSPPGVHEFYADAAADAVAVNGFMLGATLSMPPDLDLVWAIHEVCGLEVGRLHGSGLHELGVSPEKVLVVRAQDIPTLLGVGEDALRTRGVGTVLLSAWGEHRAMSLTASRRLSLAARNGGKRLLLARAGAAPQPSAAESRWSVRSAASAPLEGGAPGRPAFSATLLRHRGGATPGNWIMEWDREGRSFVEPSSLSGDLVSLVTQRPVAADGARRHA